MIQPQDSISNVDTQYSRVSKSSSGSSTSSEQRKAEAEKVELFAHAAALKDKYAFEKQKLILRRKKEQL